MVEKKKAEKISQKSESTTGTTTPITTTTKTPTTTPTTTTTTTTSTTTIKPTPAINKKLKNKKATNSPIYTFKLPFSGEGGLDSSLLRILSGKQRNMEQETSTEQSTTSQQTLETSTEQRTTSQQSLVETLFHRASTALTSRLETTTTTTTTQPSVNPRKTENLSKEDSNIEHKSIMEEVTTERSMTPSLVTWLSGPFRLNGLPTSLVRVPPPFPALDPLSWVDKIRSSLYPVTKIIFG